MLDILNDDPTDYPKGEWLCLAIDEAFREKLSFWDDEGFVEMAERAGRREDASL